MNKNEANAYPEVVHGILLNYIKLFKEEIWHGYNYLIY